MIAPSNSCHPTLARRFKTVTGEPDCAFSTRSLHWALRAARGDVMAKIPVEHTISSAYSFAFRNILTVAGIAWLPYVLAIAITAGLVVAMVPGLAAPGGPSPAAIAGLIAVAP